MKKHILLFLGLIVLIVSSCQKDESTDTIDDRDAFVGTWNVSDQIISKANYQVRIYKDPSLSTKVWMINFHGVTDTAYAYVDGKNITISQQQIGSTHLTTAGSGLMTGTSKIELEYYVSDGAQQDTISAIYLK